MMIIGNGNMKALGLIKSTVLGVCLEFKFLYPFTCKLLCPDFWLKSLLNRIQLSTSFVAYSFYIRSVGKNNESK